MIFSDCETVAKVLYGEGGRAISKTPRPFPQETFAEVSTKKCRNPSHDPDIFCPAGGAVAVACGTGGRSVDHFRSKELFFK